MKKDIRITRPHEITQETCKMFLVMANKFPPREDGQVCLIVGVERLSELMYLWLKNELTISEKDIQRIFAAK